MILQVLVRHTTIKTEILDIFNIRRESTEIQYIMILTVWNIMYLTEIIAVNLICIV